MSTAPLAPPTSRYALIARDPENQTWRRTERAIELLRDDSSGDRHIVSALDYEIEKLRAFREEGLTIPGEMHALLLVAELSPGGIDEATLGVARAILWEDLRRAREALCSGAEEIIEGPGCEGGVRRFADTAILEMQMDLACGEAPLDGLYDSLRRLSQFRVICDPGAQIVCEI